MKNSKRNRLRAEKKAAYTKRGTEARLSKYGMKRRGFTPFEQLPPELQKPFLDAVEEYDILAVDTQLYSAIKDAVGDQ